MGNANRLLLAAGSVGSEERVAISLAASSAAFDAEFAESTKDALRILDGGSADAVLVSEDEDFGSDFGLEARARSKYANVPMLSLTRELDDLSFAEVFSWGGDDAVDQSSLRGLVSRLRGFPQTLPADGEQGRGIALITDADRARRIVIGRVLRNAGYSIEFAVSADDAVKLAAEHGADLVVASAELTESPSELVQCARRLGSEATWILTCPPRDLSKHRRQVEALGNATVMDSFAPPENVLFVANELAGPSVGDNRVSRRLLFGTTVAFRGAGAERDEIGYTYNVSEGGAYIRTLAPPEDELVWLELRPPRSDRLVRAEARVRWRRRFGPNERATAPPGFGVEIQDGARTDLEAWRDGCRAFNESLGYTIEPPRSLPKK